MRISLLIITLVAAIHAQAQLPFNGLNNSLGNLFTLSGAKTRSISPENFKGEKGKGGMAEVRLERDEKIRGRSAGARHR